MLSTALEVIALAALTFGSYVAGGEAPALFVGGFSLLLLGYAADGIKVDVVGTTRAQLAKVKAKRAAKKPKG